VAATPPGTTPQVVAPQTHAASNVALPPAETTGAAVASAKKKPVAPAAAAIESEKAPRSPATTDSTAATTPVKPAEPAQLPLVPSPAAIVAPAPVDTTTKAADTTHVPLKDGTFMGWGTSRHGDIQAAVEIKEGKIASAFIVQCLTRYSCSWISALPGQVVTRQSAEVDYVSGATQSSNAFYYAIVEALKQAK
jgi:uncharacterized protein with FMN-binding domain